MDALQFGALITYPIVLSVVGRWKLSYPYAAIHEILRLFSLSVVVIFGVVLMMTTLDSIAKLEVALAISLGAALILVFQSLSFALERK